MLLTHAGRQFAVGLEWSTAVSSGEVKRTSKSKPKAFRVVRPVGGTYWLGLYDGPVKGAAYSAALAVGQVEPNAVVCEQVSDTHSWLCSVQDGLPTIGYDLLVPNGEARALASEWTASFGKSSFVGDLPGAKCTVSSLLDGFEQLVKAKGISSKDLAAMRLGRQGISVRSIATMVAMGCVAIALLWGWKYWEKLRTAQLAQKMTLANAAKSAMNAEQVEADRRRRIAAFNNQVAGMRVELENQARTSHAPLWANWHEIRRRLPVSLAGYAPASMTCTITECTVLWQGSGAFTHPADKRLLPNVIADDEPNLAAKSKFPVSASATLRPPAPLFGSAQALRLSMVNAAFGRLGGLQVDPMEPVVATPAPDLGIQPVALGARGKWRLSLGGPMALVQAEEAFQFLQQWPVQLVSVSFGSLASGGSIALEGSYALVGVQP